MSRSLLKCVSLLGYLVGFLDLGGENGGGYANLVEPRTLVLEYPARWHKPRIDLDELAKLRRAGWRTKQLSERFGVGLTTVKRASAKLRLHDG